MKKKIFPFLFILSFFIHNTHARQNPEEIKSILDHFEVLKKNSDYYYDSAYVELQKQLLSPDPVDRALWHSITAEFLAAYCQDNYFDVILRTPVAGEKNPDFKTWDYLTFKGEIIDHYARSLQPDALLKTTDINPYAILMDSMQSVEYRPTLYDFLAFRALNHFCNDSRYSSFAIITPFVIPDTVAFGGNHSFIHYRVSSYDTLSYQYQAVKLMQEITRFHLPDKNPKPLIGITLQRLQYMYGTMDIPNRDSSYLNALSTLEKNFFRQSGYEDIAYVIALYYEMKGQIYAGETQPLNYSKLSVEWFQKCIDFAPSSMIAKSAQTHIDLFSEKMVQFSTSQTLIPSQHNLISYEYSNCETLYLRIIPASSKEFKALEANRVNDEQFYSALLRLDYLHQYTLPVPNLYEYNVNIADDTLPALPVGKYYVLLSPSPFDAPENETKGYSGDIVTVSNICLTYVNMEEKYEFFISDRLSGKPLKGAKVMAKFLYSYDEKASTEQETIKTDKNGKATFTFPKKDRYYRVRITVEHGKDQYTYPSYIYQYGSGKDNTTENIQIFTDRAIYRPGQTVYFKGIVIEKKSENYQIKPKTNVLTEFSINGQSLAIESFITNEYGSFAGSFVMPKSIQTGTLSIKANQSYRHVSVEEYKRPQFEVSLDNPSGSYKLNEKVSVKGSAKAYSGYPIDEATVTYRVERYPFYPIWRPWRIAPPAYAPQLIAQGEATTDANGEFTFGFTALSEKKTADSQGLYYQYQITADVTDINGETHSGTISLNIGYTSMLIRTHFSDEIAMNKDMECLKISVENLNGKKQEAVVDFQLIPLQKPADFLHEKQTKPSNVTLGSAEYLKSKFPYLAWEKQNDPARWKELPGKITGSINTATDSCLPVSAVSSLQEGYYKCTFSSKDPFGNEVKQEQITFFYNEKSKTSVAYEPLWLTSNVKTAKPGEVVTFNIGSYLKKGFVYLKIMSNDNTVLEEWVSVSQNKKEVSLLITDKMKGELSAYAFICQNGFFYSKNISVDIPVTDKMIHFEWITFRDQLLPGEQERWKLKIKGHNGEKIAGELLCSMYDASLDAFQSNSFSLDLTSGAQYFREFFRSPERLISTYFRPFTYSNVEYYERKYYQLNWNPHSGFRYKVLSSARSAGQNSYDFMLVDEAAIESPPVMAGGMGKASILPEVTFRSNFNETAFFYPQLETDANGDLTFSFTVPESLTKWKFQGVAHTKDLKTGTFEKFVITQKPLMVVPNAPRFFREGDTVVFSSKVVNMSGQSLSGSVSMQLFDAVRNTYLIELPAKKFTMEKGGSTEVSFSFPIPIGIEAITYRITAASDPVVSEKDRTTSTFSDGEEKTLPVLSNRMLVTESMPLAIHGAGKKSFTFDKMKKNTSSSLENFNYTLEFTSNPAWYAILSLPYLMEYPYDCNEQLFSRLYANSIASHIVNSSPKIKQVFESWKNITPDAFLSNLEKNEELKNIVLEETPWIMEAKGESNRKQQVALLFDLKNLSEENDKSISKLEKNQNSDGGWSWFAGGKSNPYITRHILAGFGHLKAMNIESKFNQSSLESAISYLDNSQYKEYLGAKQSRHFDPGKNLLTPDIVHYCYTRSFYPKNSSEVKEQKEMYDFYLAQMQKNWKSMTLYTQAMAAVTLYRNDDHSTAKTIINDIKKRAQYSEEMGMFWKKEGSEWLWYEAPIERQALLIEAFSVITNDTTSVEKMQQWLLKQKQTQAWPTTKATTEACYALLLQGPENLQTTSDVKITVGNHQITADRLPKVEAGTGYFKTSWTKDSIQSDMGNITIEKSSKGTAWGGVYWQYFENLDKISPARSPLSIKKEIYKVSLNERGDLLTPITKEQPIQIGDKIRVRIEIRTDRDMEYVHLKDMRAAAFEPTNVFSGYKRQGSLWYYESTRDAATNFFFDYLPKGTYVFEYTLIASQAGIFSNGISTIQSMYAPEFSAHSQGIRVKIEN